MLQLQMLPLLLLVVLLVVVLLLEIGQRGDKIR